LLDALDWARLLLARVNQLQRWEGRSRIKGHALAAGLFAVVMLGLQLWKSWVLLAGYDQGIFQQVAWNSLHGRWFESSLSSQLSTNVVHAGELPFVGYERLGQHFTPTLLLWAPLLGVFGAAALPVVQVGLITAAGLVLHRLAAPRLPARTANWLVIAFFAGNALIGPTLGNFSDLCQLPLAVFVLMLGLLESRWALTVAGALLMPLIREDTGVILVAIGLWLLVRSRERWRLALVLIAWGGGWVVVCTNVLMPLFSDDNSKRFMVENFGQYLGADPDKGSSSLGVLKRVFSQPVLLVQQLIDPPGKTLRYLLGHSLPFLFVPLISLDTWLLAGPSLLGLFLAQGTNDPLAITIRYTWLVVPGFALGALFWWERRAVPSPGPRVRLAWGAALTLSLLLTVTSNPHRSLSMVMPDSIDPWLYSSPAQQWVHGLRAREALKVIPETDSVAANTPLVPLLAQRRAIVRFPYTTNYLDQNRQEQRVQWVAVDLSLLERYGVAFRRDWRQHKKSLAWIEDNRQAYTPQAIRDGVVVLQRQGPRHPILDKELSALLERPRPPSPSKRAQQS